jgi:hypothetical protein
MSSQVSGEHEVELKYLSLVERDPPSGVPDLPFYMSREGPGVQERVRERGKKTERNDEVDSPGAASPFPSQADPAGPTDDNGGACMLWL